MFNHFWDDRSHSIFSELSLRCRCSPTLGFQVDCTRIALDPRFKNMEGSIGAQLIHVQPP